MDLLSWYVRLIQTGDYVASEYLTLFASRWLKLRDR